MLRVLDISLLTNQKASGEQRAVWQFMLTSGKWTDLLGLNIAIEAVEKDKNALKEERDRQEIKIKSLLSKIKELEAGNVS